MRKPRPVTPPMMGAPYPTAEPIREVPDTLRFDAPKEPEAMLRRALHLLTTQAFMECNAAEEVEGIVRALLDARLSPPQAVEIREAVKAAHNELWLTFGDTPRVRPLFDKLETALNLLARVPPPQGTPEASLDLIGISGALWRFSETLQGDPAEYLRSASRCIDRSLAALQRARETGKP